MASEGFTKRWGYFKKGHWFGFERSRLVVGGELYMDRWILYFGGTLRLHKFYRGDDDRASHTHPWNFWTFPLTTYFERVYRHGVLVDSVNAVKAFRLHYRPADYEHIVMGSFIFEGCMPGEEPKPFYTIVISGPRTNSWGFYPQPGHFVYWRNYR